MFTDFLKNNKHNAFILKGNLDTAQKFVEYLKSENKWNDNDEDNIFLSYENLHMQRSLSLRKIFFLKPKIDQRIVIVHTSFFANESQQVLLKTIEELGSNNQLYIFTDFPDQIIPTIFSRAYYFEFKNNIDELKNAKTFIEYSPSERKDFILDYIPSKEDTDSDSDAKYIFMKKGIYFVDALIILQNDFIKKQKNDSSKTLAITDDLYKIRKFLFNPGVSLKMIFELLVYLIPGKI